MARHVAGERPAKVFLSYASEDANAVASVYDRLRKAGCEPWMDRRDILPGQDWHRCIYRAIRNADFIVVCLSRRAVNKRGFVQREIAEALDLWKGKLEDDIFLLPARLDDCLVPERLRPFQWVDVFDGNGVDRLLEAIKFGMMGIINKREDPGGLGYDVSVISETDEEGLAHTIRVEYPQFRPVVDPSISEINGRLAGFVSKNVLKFRKESLAQLDLPEERVKRQAFEWWRDDLQVSFAVQLLTDSLIAIEFSITTYGAGAAHPNSHTRTFNFRRHPAADLDLTDVIEPSSDYLSRLSQYCIAELRRKRGLEEEPKTFDDDWLFKGAGPNHDNFSRWIFTFLGMNVVFDPYQVDCYAAGRHEVDVPLAN